jgi:small-conductance mechanosensitive channel
MNLISNWCARHWNKPWTHWNGARSPPKVYLSEFGDSCVNYSVDVWIDNANESRGRKSDLHEALWWALKDAGIKLAYRQMDVHIDQKAVA